MLKFEIEEIASFAQCGSGMFQAQSMTSTELLD